MAVNLVLILERRLAKACFPHSLIRRIEMLNMLPVLSSWLHHTAEGLRLNLAAAEECGVGFNKDQRERGLAQSRSFTLTPRPIVQPAQRGSHPSSSASDDQAHMQPRP
ncbi:unnamed protein product [Pleuronectes platessa]|uniref:Uncharacterized protein n=1 Tax=Pleuronectes platessa TaxID=8262 RepID=A0A9N7U740_PLEPL|nr:unnamed protein product [Pleuronectes platessa]